MDYITVAKQWLNGYGEGNIMDILNALGDEELALAYVWFDEEIDEDEKEKLRDAFSKIRENPQDYFDWKE